MKKRKIPVFYHIPKNAGTYVSDWMLIAFRHYRRTYTDWLEHYTPEKDSIKVIQITKNGFIIARLLIGDPNYFCDEQVHLNRLSNTDFTIDFDKASFDWLNEVFVFSIAIEARGFKIRQDILNLFQDYNLYQFLILREPFSRAQSIYNYNTSKNSIHEFNHGTIYSKTFEDYVRSEQIEDCWLVRNLLCINDTEELKDEHFQKTVEELESFNICDIKHTDETIQKTFLECYSFDTQKIQIKEWDIITKNKTNYKKINIKDLSEQAEDIFEKRTIIDQKLYQYFLNKNKQTTMKVYTYYEDINFKHQNKLLDLWKKSWETHGYEAIVLTRVNVENHPFYGDFVEKLSNLHKRITEKSLGDYGLSCWLRWLAYATQPEEKFYVSDYDVINHNFNPTEPSNFLHLLDGDCPCIASGTPSQFYDLCEKFVNVPEKNIDAFTHFYKEFKFVHYHDQEFFRIYTAMGESGIKATRKRESFLGIPCEGEFWKKQLVHYAHSLCHRYCKQNELKFDEEIRCNIIEKYLNEF